MTKETANTEIRALNEVELDMIAGGLGLGNLLGSFGPKAEQAFLDNIVKTIQNAKAMVYLMAHSSMSGEFRQ